MPKTTQELAASKPGETAETNGFGSQERPLRPAGVYQLKNKAGELVSTIIVKSHPKFGDSQAAAAERVGYEYVRAARPDEVKEIEMDFTPAGGSTEELKGIQARLNALEKENAELKAAKVEEDTRTDDHSVVQSDSKEAAKNEAVAQTDARLNGDAEVQPDSADLSEEDLRPNAEEEAKSTEDESSSEQSSEAGSAQNDEAPSAGTEETAADQTKKKGSK